MVHTKYPSSCIVVYDKTDKKICMEFNSLNNFSTASCKEHACPVSSNFAKRYWRKIKLMEENALRKHSLYEKTAASVLLKLFISSNE